MTEKRLTQRAWEKKLQEQQDDLDRRELVMQAQEKKHVGLQQKADELRRREDAIKQREDNVADVEFRCENLLRMERYTEQLKTELEEAKAEVQIRLQSLEERNIEFLRDIQIKEDELNHRSAEVAVKEQRVEMLQDEATLKLETSRKHVDQQSGELHTLERDLKMRRVQLSEEHSSLQQWTMDLRSKEEQHDQYEKLIRDMQAVDERSRRHIKWLEDDLQRRQTELRIAREDLAAETVQQQALQVQVEEEKATIEAMKKQAIAEEASINLKMRHIAHQETLLVDREAKVAAEEQEMKELRAKLSAQEEALQEREARCATIKREAEIDMKRASAMRLRSNEEEKTNTDLKKKLAVREKELNAWDDELDWREAEFAHNVEAALNVPREPQEVPSVHDLNQAVVNVQMRKMKEQYGAGRRRRVISALQPHNRASSAFSKRTCSPLMLKTADSSYTREVQELSAESHLIAIQKKVTQLEKDFRFFAGKLFQMQSTAPTEAEKEAIMAKHFTPKERTLIDLAVVRERDVGNEANFRTLLHTSPMNNPVANPVAMVEKLNAWWPKIRQAEARRDEEVLQQRFECLTEVVDILRRMAPLFTADAKKTRAASAGPGGKLVSGGGGSGSGPSNSTLLGHTSAADGNASGGKPLRVKSATPSRRL